MTAVLKKVDVGNYVSDRVFDGTRPITDKAKADRMRARTQKAIDDATAPAGDASSK